MAGAIDLHWMRRAYELAQQAQEEGEVPVGAVVTHGTQWIAEGHNRPIKGKDPTAHAEIQAIRAAAKKQKNYRLPGHTLYVTLEPCAMCAGAIIHARIERVVFGALDPRAGASSSVYDILSKPKLNHVVAVEGGVMADECGQILTDFFRARR